MKDCHALKSMQKRERGVLAMQINSTLDGTEMQDTANAGVTQTDEDSVSQIEIPWLDGDASD